jgi:hypothetical protein
MLWWPPSASLNARIAMDGLHLPLITRHYESHSSFMPEVASNETSGNVTWSVNGRPRTIECNAHVYMIRKNVTQSCI